MRTCTRTSPDGDVVRVMYVRRTGRDTLRGVGTDWYCIMGFHSGDKFVV